MASISVITVVRDDPEGFARTLESVRSQTVQPVEHIVWDGGSVPEVCGKIRRLAHQERFFAGGEDRGVYDGMNRALEMAAGDWVHFLNGDDIFASPQVIETVSRHLSSQKDVVYGNHRTRFPDGTLWERAAKPVDVLRYRIPFCHQAAFTRRDHLLGRPFCVDRINSDFALFHSLYRAGCVFHHIDCTVAEVSAGGLSDRRRLRKVREDFDVVREISGNSSSLTLYFARRFTVESLKLVFKRVFPYRFRRQMQRFSHRLNG